MAPATEGRSRRALDVCLAGLEAGMISALWLVAWMGGSAVLQRRGFWNFENLLASVFYGGDAIRAGIGWTTISGLALFLFAYSILGALFASALRDRFPRLRLMLAGIVFGLCWYYLWYRWLSRSVAPLVALLHIESSTRWGHVLYGAMLSRYPTYLERGKGATPEISPAAIGESTVPAPGPVAQAAAPAVDSQVK